MDKVTLNQFVKGIDKGPFRCPGCANLHRASGECVFGGKCKVGEGVRCEWFERRVLPGADEIRMREQLQVEYNEVTGANIQLADPEARRCGCGRVLKPRRRKCDECRDRSARESHRKTMQKLRGRKTGG